MVLYVCKQFKDALSMSYLLCYESRSIEYTRSA